MSRRAIGIRKVSSVLAVCALAILAGVVAAQLSDDELIEELKQEAAQVDIATPGPGDPALRPVERIPREEYGVVGPAPLTAADLDALIFPAANSQERASVLTGLAFFTTAQTGRGPVSNQPNCLGCHRNSDDSVSDDLVTTSSPASRAGRASPTNFAVTGQGRAADHDDAINDTGRTASFTIFGDFCAAGTSCPRLAPLSPIPRGAFDGLARAPFFGFVQQTRPADPSCPPKRLPSLGADSNLTGLDPVNGWMNDWVSPAGFRRSVVERAAPPYIGRGLMEAIPNADILALAGPKADGIAGRANMATTTQTIAVGGLSTPHLGRFGLRAQGPQLIVFDAVGAQEEVGTTNVLRPTRNMSVGCASPVHIDIPLSTIFSLRNMIRLTTLPEFGDTLLELLQSHDPTARHPKRSEVGRVQRGATLFGIDLTAFANRMIPDRMPPGGDGRDPHAINQSDLKLNCVGCHTPVQRTGRSPAQVGAEHLSFKLAPVFSDMLLHKMPVINAERFAPTARLPLVVERGGDDTFDLSRNFGEDALPNQGLARGDEFRTAPLMGLGVIGPPFLHDARVFLSTSTVDTMPASTVMTHRHRVNVPLVVRTLDDAIRAAIELHDLPAPGSGCPVPPTGRDGLVRVGDVVYGSPQAAETAICPPLDSPNRGEAREVLRRFRELSREDQQAVIDFLKQL
jgi:Di-haem oxidoreductase, putative peroxidase